MYTIIMGFESSVTLAMVFKSLPRHIQSFINFCLNGVVDLPPENDTK